METLVVIPARYGSKRFAGKPLALIKGKPMVQHVYEGVKGSKLADRVVVATDDTRIIKTADLFIKEGDRVVMTSASHQSGTDRVGEVVRDLEDVGIVVNVQGDEPLIAGHMVDMVIKGLQKDSRAQMSTLIKKITNEQELFDPNTVKVTVDSEGFALYFSRATIPHYREFFGDSCVSSVNLSDVTCYKHIGIYGYKRSALLRLIDTAPCVIEEAEKLEQLRALYLGIKIKIQETHTDIMGVDTQEDLLEVEKWLNTYS